MFSVIWFLGVGLMVAGVSAHYRFIQRIKSHHPQLYLQLGSPTALTQYPPSQFISNSKFTATLCAASYADFMVNQQWLSVGDEQLTRLAALRRYAQLALGLLLLLAIVLFAWLQFAPR